MGSEDSNAGIADSTNDIIRISTGERNTFGRCPQAWYWAYVENLRPKVQKFKEAADFGVLIHSALEQYYRPGLARGPHPADTFDALAKDVVLGIKTQEAVNDELINKWEDFHDLGVELLEEYIYQYGDDSSWNVIDAERKFNVAIPDVRYKPIMRDGKRGWKRITNFIGVFDLCFRDLSDNKIKMVDHKTVGFIDTQHLKLDAQASGYIAVASHALREQELIGKDEVVAGMIYNYIRRGKPYKAPLKQDLLNAVMNHTKTNVNVGDNNKPWAKYLKEELAAFADSFGLKVRGEPTDNPLFMRHFEERTNAERNRTIRRISQEASVMADIRSGKIPVTKSTSKECRFCDFSDLCELDEGFGDTEYFKETVFKKVDQHRLEFDNIEHGVKATS